MEEITYRETHQVQVSHWWYQGRLQIIDTVLSKFLKKNGSLSVLEIGAGSGVNIGRLQAYGTVDAVEMHEGGRRMIRDEFPDVEVRNGALPDTEVFADKRFDVVCMFDVLEHVEPQIEALQVMLNHVTPDARLFITVPAYQWLWTEHDNSAHHFRRYTRKTLEDALKTAGWSVDLVGYFNTRLFPLALVARMKDKLLKPKIATGLRLPGNLTNTLFQKIFSGEASKVANGGYSYGLSLFAVASPRENAVCGNSPKVSGGEQAEVIQKGHAGQTTLVRQNGAAAE